MRILELRFKNLNSLYGEWVIDFACPEFIREGIFLISGPTGAGKSTLLDAMCLALYGRTPRLNSISQSGNEIMSRQTGECFAEVSFETASGRFVAHWSQRRAYRKPDGNLVDSKHEISDGASGKILASKKRDTAARIVRETGMDFDRFTRSMMLAQGGFAAFLQAAPDERAPILEQITGTGIYSSISKKVHERLAEEKDRLELLKAEAGGIQVLDESQVEEIEKTLEEKLSGEAEYLAQQKALSQFMEWLKKIESLEKELLDLGAFMDKAEKENAAFEPERERLNQALKAAELDSEYATLSASREQQRADIGLLEKSRARVPDLEKSLEARRLKLKEAGEARVKIQAEQAAEQELIKLVRAKDQQIAQQKKSLESSRDDLVQSESRLSRLKKQLEVATAALQEKEKMLKTISVYLSDHARDGEIPVLLASMQEKQNRLKEIQASQTSAKDQLSLAKKAHEKQIRQKETQEKISRDCKKDYLEAGTLVSAQEKAMAELLDGRSLKGYRTERDGLMREMFYRQTIARLEDERSKLVRGEACPLCGAKEHPFSIGHIPKPDKIQAKIDQLNQRIETLESMEDAIRGAREKEQAAGRRLEESEKVKIRIQYELERIHGDIEHHAKTLESYKLQETELTASLVHALKSFDPGVDTGKTLEEVLEALEKRAREFKEKQADENRIRKTAGEKTALVKGFKGKLEELERTFKKGTSALATQTEALARLDSERERVYGKKDPEDIEKQMARQLADASGTEARAMKLAVETEKELKALSESVSELEKRVTERTRSLEDMENSFAGNLKTLGFENEKIFSGGRLPAEERNRLVQESQKLEQAMQALSARQKDRRDQLAAARDEKLTDRTKEDIEKAYSENSATLRDLGEKIGALKQKLSDNTNARNRLKDQVRKIDLQKKACGRWGTLHALIGSADGKKYRNFAQGITFELMISHANRQLEKMSDRYLLVRDETRPLELNIIDDYQAGEVRSTKNLSGGESFIVSLCLALGLSGMASRNVRVDSLFLDEGFGTLDEEALETALHALGTLQQTGKLVGLISHVPALKESINTQIQIAPVSGGKSIISGPGCNSVEN